MFGPSEREDSRWIRAAITFFVLATCIRVWLGPAEIVERASAQISDPGMQRKLAIDEARRTNELLTEIKRHLETKVLNVRIAGADNKAGSKPVPGGKER